MTRRSGVITSAACGFTVLVVACVCASPGSVMERPPGQSATPQSIRLTAKDGGLVHADLYGAGTHGVVMAHGGRFNKASWVRQAEELARAGYRVVAIDFRGYGESRGPGQDDIFSAPLHIDVLAAVHYLRESGAKIVSAIGGSLGGGAAANASSRSLAASIV